MVNIPQSTGNYTVEDGHPEHTPETILIGYFFKRKKRCRNIVNFDKSMYITMYYTMYNLSRPLISIFFRIVVLSKNNNFHNFQFT